MAEPRAGPRQRIGIDCVKGDLDQALVLPVLVFTAVVYDFVLLVPVM